jgi:hypothetical protein
VTSAPAASHRVAAGPAAAAVVVAAFLLLVVAASAGPVTLFHPTAPQVAQVRAPATTAPRHHVPSGSLGPTYAQLTKHQHAVVDLSWLSRLLAWTVLAGLVLALARALLRGVPRAWQRRWRAPPRPETVDFEVLPADALRDALGDDDESRREVVERGEVREAIVACWLRLEEVVARCGVARRPAETSTELVTRVLRALDVDPRAVGALSGLYHEARFSAHALTEDTRSAARAALEALQRDLPDRGRVP